MENIESKMQAFEESVELNEEEIEKNQEKVADFEDQYQKDRNEGMFFKSLGLIGLLVIGIADAFISSSSDWQKIAALGVILLALLSQFIWI